MPRSETTISKAREQPKAFPPLNVWNEAALFFLSTLPDTPGAKADPFYFVALISWNIPDNGKPSEFRVKAVATNTRLPSMAAGIFNATLDFPLSRFSRA